MSDTPQTLDNSLNGLFNNTLMQYVFEFLAIYIVGYFLMGYVFNQSGDRTLQLVRILDTVVFVFIVIILVITYGNTTIDTIGTKISDSLKTFKNFADNPFSIFAVILFIVLLYSSVYLVRIPMTPELKPFSIMIIENIALLMIVVLLIFDFFKYILDIDLLNYAFEESKIISTPSPSPTATAMKPTATSPPQTDEVFNIRNNLYTYNEAQEVCSIYGAKLATYDQIEKSYNEGGEWCNYGWSEGQMALFPTQKSTWTKLQTSDKSKNACGRPGVNGGYIKNKNVRFGVNCYGKKPKPSDHESALMAANATPNIPMSAADKAMKSKMDMLKKNANKFLVLNSFNRNKWSELNK